MGENGLLAQTILSQRAPHSCLIVKFALFVDSLCFPPYRAKAKSVVLSLAAAPPC